jgi:hypothetical protein
LKKIRSFNSYTKKKKEEEEEEEEKEKEKEKEKCFQCYKMMEMGTHDISSVLKAQELYNSETFYLSQISSPYRIFKTLYSIY